MLNMVNIGRIRRIGIAKRNFWLLVYSMAATSTASAAETGCLPYKAMLDEPVRACKCGSNLSGKYELDTTPAGKIIATRRLPLVAVCKYELHSFGTTGSFYFRGGAEVAGYLRREETDSAGDSISLSRFSTASFAQVPSLRAVATLRLAPTESAISRLRPPALSEEAHCWVAPATLYVRELALQVDAGTDNGGAFLTSYKVLKVGKYVRCDAGGFPSGRDTTRSVGKIALTRYRGVQRIHTPIHPSSAFRQQVWYRLS